MRLSALAWLHNLLYACAAIFAVYLGAVSVYAEASAFEKGRREGAIAATARHIHRYSLQELNDLDMGDI